MKGRPKKLLKDCSQEVVFFKCANGFHTSESSAAPLLVVVFTGTLPLTFSACLFSFLPSPLKPFLLLCPCTRPSIISASSAAALSSPRSVKPSNRRAALATRYRVLTRAGAGVRLGRLRVGEGEDLLGTPTRRGRESDVVLLLLPLLLGSPAFWV